MKDSFDLFAGFGGQKCTRCAHASGYLRLACHCTGPRGELVLPDGYILGRHMFHCKKGLGEMAVNVKVISFSIIP